ncbi:MAG: transcriptional repressor [Lachnospiraceae bacterium]|nr:transcriptional repressor [Lachnospiraceae bacterium]
MAKLKRSRQREAIIAFLQTRKDHPTADTVYMSLRETMPNLSLGTVYRNLSLLAEQGKILKFSCDGKVDRFDGFVHPHYHFMCVDCGEVSDVEMDMTELLTKAAAEHTDGLITGHTVLFKGYCARCRENNQTA